MINILLIILAVIVFLGIIRVILKPCDSILEFIVDILWLDVLSDILTAIMEHIDFD